MPITLEMRGKIAWIVLDEPERRNPLTTDFIPRMLEILDAIEADPECRVGILVGRGPVFCAGADLGSIIDPQGVDPEVQYQLIRGFNRVVCRMRELDQPIIGAINGPAVGGGAALALACDFAVAAESATLHFAFGRVGASSADMGCTWLLAHLVGPARARFLILTGARVDAKDGLELGIFVGVVPPEELEEACNSIASQIIKATPKRGAAADKMALALAESTDLRTALDYEAYVQSWMFQSDDHKERLAAFMNRKK